MLSLARARNCSTVQAALATPTIGTLTPSSLTRPSSAGKICLKARSPEAPKKSRASDWASSISISYGLRMRKFGRSSLTPARWAGLSLITLSWIWPLRPRRLVRPQARFATPAALWERALAQRGAHLRGDSARRFEHERPQRGYTLLNDASHWTGSGDRRDGFAGLVKDRSGNAA